MMNRQSADLLRDIGRQFRGALNIGLPNEHDKAVVREPRRQIAGSAQCTGNGMCNLAQAGICSMPAIDLAIAFKAINLEPELSSRHSTY